MANAIPVLMYHHVSHAPGLVTVSPRTFQTQMTALARAGYTTLSAVQLRDYLSGEQVIPDKSVAITFDDGYLDNYVHAYPVLKALGLHAIIFAVTDWIGEGTPRAFDGGGQDFPACLNHSSCKAAIAAGHADTAMLRWSEIEIMEADATMEIHSHSHRHVRWDQCYADRTERLSHVRDDLAASLQTLRQRLGARGYQLCWPWGKFDADYQRVAAELGFAAQYSVDPHPNIAGMGANDIGRFTVKDASAFWLTTRLWLYSRPGIARRYNTVAGKGRAYG